MLHIHNAWVGALLENIHLQKTVRITKGVKKKQQTNPSLRSVIHIMDFSSSNCYFWLCICNYRCTSCCGNGFEFKGILEAWCSALAWKNFCTCINRESVMLMVAHSSVGFDWDVWRIRRWTEFARGIYGPCVQVHTWTMTHMHTLSLSFSLILWLIQIQLHPHPNHTLTNKPACTPNGSWVYLLPWKRW